jgi:hypothetical protein
MEPFDRQINTHQHRALNFMLYALGLRHATNKTRYATGSLRLGPQMPALLREHRRLCQRFAELEHEVRAVAAELEALDRAIDGCIDAERERRANDI